MTTYRIYEAGQSDVIGKKIHDVASKEYLGIVQSVTPNNDEEGVRWDITVDLNGVTQTVTRYSVAIPIEGFSLPERTGSGYPVGRAGDERWRRAEREGASTQGPDPIVRALETPDEDVKDIPDDIAGIPMGAGPGRSTGVTNPQEVKGRLATSASRLESYVLRAAGLASTLVEDGVGLRAIGDVLRGRLMACKAMINLLEEEKAQIIATTQGHVANPPMDILSTIDFAISNLREMVTSLVQAVNEVDNADAHVRGMEHISLGAVHHTRSAVNQLRNYGMRF